MRMPKVVAALLGAAMLSLVPTTAGAAPAPGPAPAVSVQQAALAAGLVCRFEDPIAILANWNSTYVSTERDYAGTSKGMLRARNGDVGPWETYYLCFEESWGPNEFAFLAAANGKFVSAEFDYGTTNKGMLRARNDTAGVWERFNWFWSIDGSTLQSTWNGKYVTAEHDDAGTRKGMLRARTDPAAVDVWEKFTIVWLP